MSPKPVIFLAFANDREDNARYLRNIPAEYNAIRQTLINVQDMGLCEVEMLPYSTFQDIKNVFTAEKYRNRIAIFHFSGHADGFQLLLENAEGKNDLAHGKGLVDYFTILKTQHIQENLQLLFFNGCCTAQLGEDLKGIIPAIIGTVDTVNDEQAKAIAVSFYENLARQIEIKTSFDLAKAERHVGNANLRGLYHKDLKQEPMAEPWQFYAKKNFKNWKLQKDRTSLIYKILTITLLLVAYPLYQYFFPPQPFNFTIKVKELTPNPNLSFENGKISMQIGDKTEILEILKEQSKKEVIFQQIPPNLKSKKVKVLFEAEGFVKIDSMIALEKDFIEIGIRRDESLSKIYGVVMDEKQQAVENASVSIQDLTTETDSNGKFEIKIPFEKQLKKQRIRVNKNGYAVWDHINPVIGVEIQIVLKKNFL